jgi:hypothetical protein
VFDVPVTAAENVIDRQLSTDPDDGVIDTTTGGGGGVTVTVAVSDLVGSAWLVATTVHVRATVGAVYTPAGVIVPHPAVGTDHVTAVFDAFATIAVNVTVPPATTEGVLGEIATLTGATTLTAACPLTAGAARLVALTWNTPDEPGAV